MCQCVPQSSHPLFKKPSTEPLHSQISRQKCSRVSHRTRGKERGLGEGSGRGQALHDVKIIFLQQHPGLPREARARHAHGLAGNASLGCQRQARQSRFCQPEPYRPSHNMHAYKSQCGGRCNQETKLFCQSFLLMCFHVLTFVLLCTPLSS